MPTVDVPIRHVDARAYTIPTEHPEADATLCWDRTTLIAVEIDAGIRGFGYTYGTGALTRLIDDALTPILLGRDALAIPARWRDMRAALRNVGLPGAGAMAVSALDAALWDLKARLFDVPLSTLLGAVREAVPIYGSGGFTSDSDAELERQLQHWLDDLDCRFVKIKIGPDTTRDVERMTLARDIAAPAELMVDGNGGYTPKQALLVAERLADLGGSWFEEPLSSDDLTGLAALRERVPAPVEIAAGEYAHDPLEIKALIDAGAVDTAQIDVTRCCGITGFLRAAAIAEAAHTPISTHTAPALHLHVACAVPMLRHVEWFHDHVRIEQSLLDGMPHPVHGQVRLDLARPGHGLEFKRADAERFAR